MHSFVLFVIADYKPFLKIFLHSFKESERLIATIVALFLLIIAIRRVQRFRFFTLYFFKKEDSTNVRLLSLQGNGLDNELLRLAPRMDNLQTVKPKCDLATSQVETLFSNNVIIEQNETF